MLEKLLAFLLCMKKLIKHGLQPSGCNELLVFEIGEGPMKCKLLVIIGLFCFYMMPS